MGDSPDIFGSDAPEEEALAYAKRNGFETHIVPAPPVKLKLQAYADNFR